MPPLPAPTYSVRVEARSLAVAAVNHPGWVMPAHQLTIPRAIRRMPTAAPPIRATRPPRRVSQLLNRCTASAVRSGLSA
jgi:hypothetical protein